MTKENFEEIQSPNGFNVRIPNEIKNSDEFLNLIKEILKDYDNRLIDYSQECEGTFKIKDGNVTDINITGIALVPRFRGKK